jgi:hypothetical protein
MRIEGTSYLRLAQIFIFVKTPDTNRDPYTSHHVAMKRNILLLLTLYSFFATAQDFPKMARELQPKYQDHQAVIITSNLAYEFSKDPRFFVKASEAKTEKILSLRYNEVLYQSEVYDNNSRIEKFFAESNLKQKATDASKSCGTYTHEGLFYDDSKFCTHQLKLKEVGEVWNVTSIKKIGDAKYLTTIYFEEEFPVLERTIRFIIPSDLEIEIKEFNLTGYKITRQQRTEGSNTVIEFLARELAGLQSESFGRGMQYNHPHLLVLLKSVSQSGKKTNILASAQDLYSWYSSLTKQLKPNPQMFQQTVNQLIKDKPTDEEKIKSIYYWVQDNIRYIAFEDGIAGFKPDEAHNVFEKKYGDCKGMANLTKEMLRAAGFDARLTWIGTKRIMYDQTLPSLAVNNHMICTVILGSKRFFLDPTEKYMPFGENADRIQNRSVMIEDGDKFILDKVATAEKNRDVDARNLVARIDGENLEGSYKVNLKGEAKKNFLYSYNYTKTDLRNEFVSDFISNGNKNVQTRDVRLPNIEERSGPLSLECALTFTGAVSSFNNEYYIDIDPSKHFKNWTIKDTRQSDVDFGEKVNKKTSIELQIPKGYTVSMLPESVTVNEPEFFFSLNYKLAGNKIVYTKELSIPEGIIKKQSFQKWNDAIKKLVKAYENQIVLKK